MLRSIMVPLDGSELAEQALPVAIALARRASAVIRLVRVHERPQLRAGAPRADEVDAAFRAAEHAQLDDVVRRIDLAGAAATAAVLEGEPAESIVRHALAERVAMIVMATHGRTGVSRAWLGSVADDVVRRAGVPVLLIRARDDRQPLVEARGFRSIVVPLDGSPLAEAALEPALLLAGLFHASLTLLRIVEPVFAIPPTYGYPAPQVPPDQELFETLVAGAEDHLRGLAARMRQRHPVVDVRTVVVPAEHVARGILGHARAPEFDLIAMTTGGRGPSRLVVGSVADTVLRGSTLPLLLLCPSPRGAHRAREPEGEESGASV